MRGVTVREIADQDLFEVLAIRFREDSHVELLANALQHDQRLTRAVCREWLGPDCPATDPVRCETRVSLTGDGSKNVPDLVLLFGDCGAESHAWIIEAKIEAGEGDHQLDRYAANKERLVGRLQLGPEVNFLTPAFLTLDGREATSGRESLAIDFSPLVGLLKPESYDEHWMETAVEQLRTRLDHYYSSRAVEPDLSLSLERYLQEARGLVTAKDLFTWLVQREGESLGFRTTSGVAQNRGTAHPLVTFSHDGWRSGAFPQECELADCYNIHLEVHLVPEARNKVVLHLHYETDPYVAGLATKKKYEPVGVAAYWQKRARFAQQLSRTVGRDDAEPRWKLAKQSAAMPTGNNRNQLAKLAEDFAADGSLAQFMVWLGAGLRGMAGAIDRTLDTVGQNQRQHA